MICSLIYRGKTYYLDATNEYINAEFIPESIQGREGAVGMLLTGFDFGFFPIAGWLGLLGMIIRRINFPVRPLR